MFVTRKKDWHEVIKEGSCMWHTEMKRGSFLVSCGDDGIVGRKGGGQAFVSESRQRSGGEGKVGGSGRDGKSFPAGNEGQMAIRGGAPLCLVTCVFVAG